MKRLRSRAILGLGVAVAAVAIAAGCGDDDDDGGEAAASCPKGTEYHEGACIETKLRPKKLDWKASNKLCVSEGRRIPALAELQTFLPDSGGDQKELEWTNLRYRAGSEELAGLVSGDGTIEIVPSTTKQVSRCVAAPQD